MKEDELRKIANCALCGKPFGHAGAPDFYRVRVEQYVVDFNAVKRQDGLSSLMDGYPALAAAIGPNEDMAKKAYCGEITVCHGCAFDTPETVASILEGGMYE